MLTRSDISNVIRQIIRNDKNYLTVVWDIDEFNQTFDIPVNRPLYVDLIREETFEFIEELIDNGVSPALLKELSDVVYVLEGLLGMIEDEELPDDIDQDDLFIILEEIKRKVVPVAQGYFTEAQRISGFMETHRSNMSKLDRTGAVLRREDGKVLKSDQYTPADLTPLYSRSMAVLNVSDMLGMRDD